MSPNMNSGNPVDESTAALKIPPHSIEAEQSVLGGLMLDNNAWDQVIDLISEEDFYRHDHRMIFSAIANIAARSEPCDVITLSEELDKIAELDNVGGLQQLGMLAKNTPSAANIRAYAEIVREKSVLRQLIEVGTTISNSGYQPDGRTSSELLDLAESLVFKIAEQGSKSKQGFQDINELLVKAVDKIDTLYNSDSPDRKSVV